MDEEHSQGTPLALPRWLTCGAVATMCREAALAFLDGVAADWRKRELAAWLVCPYRAAARYGDWAHRTIPPPSHTEEPELVRPEQIDRVLREARWHILAALEAVALPGSRRAFVDVSLSAGHVVPRRDCDGGVAWVPVDLRMMRLRDRVESLFAADYLIRPKDYVTDLTVCHRCESVLFDSEARRRGDCGMHRPSGVTERERPRVSGSIRAPTLPGLGKRSQTG